MLDGLTRTLKDQILEPFMRAIPAWVHPNAITFLSLPFGLAAAVLTASGYTWWSVVAFLVNRILDGLDGLIARRRNLQSDFGGYADIMIDFVVYAAIPIGVWARAGMETTLPLVVLLAVFYVNAASWMYLSALIEKRGRSGVDGAQTVVPTSVVMPRGLVEGTETVVFYFAFLLFPWIAGTLFWAMASATLFGVVQRVIWAGKALS